MNIELTAEQEGDLKEVINSLHTLNERLEPLDFIACELEDLTSHIKKLKEAYENEKNR